MRKKLLLVSVFILFVGFAFGFLKWKETISANEALVFHSIDLNKVKDGNYIGTCRLGLVKAIVQVTLKDGELVDMELLKHEHGLGEKAEGILETMIKENRLDVDDVSGATISSRAIRKASEAALLTKDREKLIS